MAAMLDEMVDAVLRLDADWRILYANTSARRTLHLGENDLNSRTWWELFPETIETELARKLGGVLRNRNSDQCEIFLGTRDLWLDFRITFQSEELFILFRDVTAQNHEVEQARAVAQQLDQVLASTTDAIFYLDRNYIFTYLNRRAIELLAPEGDLLGAHVWQRFPQACFPGSPYVENYRRSMDEGLPSEFNSYYGAPLNLWLRVETRPAENGIVVFFRDVTEERANQDASRLQREETERQHAELESLYRTAPVGLALFDPVEFRYLKLNDRQAEYYGVPPDQLLGHAVTELAEIPGLQELFEQVARGDPVSNLLVEGELATRPGAHRYWTINYDPVFAPDGSVIAISTVALEITRQKQVEAAMIQGEKLVAVGRLAASISHEIRNPLESVTNLLYLVATDDTLAAASREYLEMAQAEVSRIAEIATQTLHLNRQSVQPTLVSAPQLIGDVIKLYQARLTKAGVSVETRYASRTPFLCYESDLRQVLNNLIANAVDAMDGGGRLLIRVHDATDLSRAEGTSANPGVRITIADTGCGMSAATKVRLFEPFYTTKELAGTGLGLWVSSEIVNRHGGHLHLNSSQRAAHHGTVFSLFLPLKCA